MQLGDRTGSCSSRTNNFIETWNNSVAHRVGHNHPSALQGDNRGTANRDDIGRHHNDECSGSATYDAGKKDYSENAQGVEHTVR